jgi:hypothetical protein
MSSDDDLTKHSMTISSLQKWRGHPNTVPRHKHVPSYLLSKGNITHRTTSHGKYGEKDR